MAAVAPLPDQPIRILIADDQREMRWMIRRVLTTAPGFTVVGEAADGREALEIVLRNRPDVALVDLDMPVLDGIGMIRSLRGTTLPTRTLVLTSNNDRAAIDAAIEAGADGYVLKGCSAEEMRDAIRSVWNGGAVLAPAVARSVLQGYVAMMEERRARDFAVIRTLANAVERRDEGTGNHANNVARLSTDLWHLVTGEAPDDDLVYGFLLHDVGKIAIPDAVLLKPGPLEPEEQDTMRRHVDIGVELIEPLGFAEPVVDVIRFHHERWDGSGYPRGLRGDEIPLSARVFSVVDAYDAMTSDRPYRRGMPIEQALAELARYAGRHFDPACVDAFHQLAGEGGLE